MTSIGHLFEHRCPTLFGDSGGPILVRDADGLRLIGIVVGVRGSEAGSVGIAVPTARFAEAIEQRGVTSGPGWKPGPPKRTPSESSSERRSTGGP